MAKFVVTKDNPYYPEVVYCETIHEAENKRDEWFSDLNEGDGKYECLIVIAEIKAQKPFRSYY